MWGTHNHEMYAFPTFFESNLSAYFFFSVLAGL